MKKLIVAFFLFGGLAFSQLALPPRPVTVDPSASSCVNGSAIQFNVNNQKLWGCSGSVWVWLNAPGAGNITIPNDNSTGTTTQRLAKINSSGNAIIATTSDTAIPVYCVSTGAGTSGSAILLGAGRATCKTDAGGATIGHYLGESTTIAGMLVDLGTSVPAGVYTVGIALTTAAANSNVDFEAVGYVGGITFNSGDILTAINALPAGGGQIQLACNTTFVVTTATIAIHKNVVIRGCGNSSVIQMGANFNAIANTLISIATNGIRVKFENLKIDGNRASNATSIGYIVFIDHDITSSTEFDNVTFANSNVNTVIGYFNAFNGYVHGCRFFNNTTHSILAQANTPGVVTHHIFSNNDFQYSTYSISGATNASPIVITTTSPHNMVTGQRVGITGIGGNTAANFEWTITVLSATTFSLGGSTGNGAYTSGGVAGEGGWSIAILTQRGVQVSNNTAYSGGEQIAVGLNTTDSVIANNTLQNSIDSGITCTSDISYSDTSHNQFTGNMITNSLLEGIYIGPNATTGGSCSNNVFEGNQVQSSGRAAVSGRGSGVNVYDLGAGGRTVNNIFNGGFVSNNAEFGFLLHLQANSTKIVNVALTGNTSGTISQSGDVSTTITSYPLAVTSTAVVPDAGATHNFVTAVSSAGAISKAQPACGDLSNAQPSCSTDTTNASNISSGTLPPGRLPNPSASTLGGIESLASSAHRWINQVSTSGVPSTSQPACGDLSDAVASCNTDATNAGNISSGLLQVARGGTNCAAPYAVNPQTSTYAVVAADFTCMKTITVASGTFTITLVASGSQPAAGTWIRILNYGSGVVTVARNGQNINGGTTSLILQSGSATVPSQMFVTSDGTNYFAGDNFANPMTSAGDIIYGSTTGLPTRLAAGTTGTPLLAGSPPTYSSILYLTSLISGGVVCGTSTTQLASSALLAANGIVTGGGAGACPQTTSNFSFSGTTFTLPGATGFTPSANSTAALRVNNAAGTQQAAWDTSNNRYMQGCTNAPDATVTVSNATSCANTIAPPGGTIIHAIAADGAAGRIVIDSFGVPSQFFGRQAHGTIGSLSATQIGDALSTFGGGGYDGTAYTTIGNSPGFTYYAEESWNTGAHGSYLGISTVAAGGITPTEKIRVSSSGGLEIGNVGVDPGAGQILVNGLKTTGAAAGKVEVCVDLSTGKLYASSSATNCLN